MAKELSAVEVNRLLKRPVLGRHRVSKNLYLQVRGENTGSWLFRYMTNGKPHHLGLGRVDLFSLAEARQRAKVCGQQLTDKIDPLAAKRRRVTVEKIEAAKNITFGECARRYIKAHAPEWKNEKHDQLMAQHVRRLQPSTGTYCRHQRAAGRLNRHHARHGGVAGDLDEDAGDGLPREATL